MKSINFPRRNVLHKAVAFLSEFIRKSILKFLQKIKSGSSCKEYNGAYLKCSGK
jgi:hypothetical protein